MLNFVIDPTFAFNEDKRRRLREDIEGLGADEDDEDEDDMDEEEFEGSGDSTDSDMAGFARLRVRDGQAAEAAFPTFPAIRLAADLVCFATAAFPLLVVIGCSGLPPSPSLQSDSSLLYSKLSSASSFEKGRQLCRSDSSSDSSSESDAESTSESGSTTSFAATMLKMDTTIATRVIARTVAANVGAHLQNVGYW